MLNKQGFHLSTLYIFYQAVSDYGTNYGTEYDKPFGFTPLMLARLPGTPDQDQTSPLSQAVTSSPESPKAFA